MLSGAGDGAAPTNGAGAPQDLIKDADMQSFAADVLEASMGVPVIVDFWAPWCGPCKTLTPVLEKAVTEAGGAVRLVKVNIDENKMLAQQLTQAGLPLQSIPAVFAFKDGQPVDGFVGAQPESQVKEFIARLGGEAPAEMDMAAQIEEALAAAANATEQGDLAAAAQIYGAILQQDASNTKALVGLAQLYLKAGETERATQTLDLVGPDAAKDPDVIAARAALDLAARKVDRSEIDALEAKIAADPKDHQARIDLASALAAEGDQEGALNALLESIRIDRAWNEEAARKQLVQFFDAWGAKDEFTLSGRRQLSSILFS